MSIDGANVGCGSTPYQAPTADLTVRTTPDPVAYLCIQSALADLQASKEDASVWRDVALVAIQELASASRDLSTAKSRERVAHRELARYTEGQVGGGQADMTAKDSDAAYWTEGARFDGLTTCWPANSGQTAQGVVPSPGPPWYDDVSICQRPAPGFLIDGLIQEESLAFLWGAPSTGKTFLALALALSVTTGHACLERRVLRQGPCIYVLGEGAGHFSRRITAWKTANGVPTDCRAGLSIVGGAINLLNHGEVSRFIEIAKPVKPVLIVFDTLTRMTAGADENAVQDMSRAIKSLDRIRAEVGASILVTTHATKRGQEERGSSAIRGAADVMFEMKRVGAVLVLRPDKSKDFELPPEIELELVSEPGAGSLVVQLRSRIIGVPSESEKQALVLLSGSFPSGTTIGPWGKAAGIADRSAYRLAQRLQESGLVRKDRQRYHITDEGRRAIAESHL